MMCGACVAGCPINVLYVGGKEEPTIIGPCAACQVCYYSCPRLELPLDEIEQTIFGRTRTVRDEPLGIYKRIYSAKATDEKFLRVGQDGGTAIALLAYALEIDLIDCFVTVNFAKSNSAFVLAQGVPMKPVPFIGSATEEVIDTAGSKYCHSGILGGLSDTAASFPNGRIGLVALPCELQGLRHMETSLQSTFKFGGSGVTGGRPALTIGLFCSKAYYYDKLVGEFIRERHGIDPAKVTRTVIKRGRFKVYVDSEALVDVPLKELEGYMSEPCRYCIDYAAELADISVGAIGSPDGWNTVIVRTELGERLFESALKANAIEAHTVDRIRPTLDPLLKLATKKKQQNNAYYLRLGILEERTAQRRLKEFPPGT
jgi:coenzyme F420 hydrogenase subunit beta